MPGQEGEDYWHDYGFDTVGRTLWTVSAVVDIRAFGTGHDWIRYQVHPVNVFALNDSVPIKSVKNGINLDLIRTCVMSTNLFLTIKM